MIISTNMEQAIADDVRYFERAIANMEAAITVDQLEAVKVYSQFTARRKQLLAALRAGRPQAWREF